MNQDLQPIITLLEKQKTLQEELISLSQEKRGVIIKGNVERLNEITQAELKQLSKINALEKQRKTLLSAIAEKMAIPAEEITVSMLIREAEESEEKRQLIVLQKELTGLLQVQAELNKQNQSLLETQLDYNDVMINAIVGPEDPLNNFYGGDGKSEDERRQSAGLFDQQI